MKVTWLGQAGLLFEGNGIKIMIDPYFSDCVKKRDPRKYRRQPVNEEYLKIVPDIMIFTHDHIDHYDSETAALFLGKNEKKMTVLSPSSVWTKLKGEYGEHNCVQFNRYTSWSEYGFRFTAVKAEHSDPYAIGVIIEDIIEGKTYYVTGDTLYSSEIFEELPPKIDIVFLPINGVGNNMNMTDAERFAKKIGAKRVVPIHFGMFDDINPFEWNCENKVVPKIWNKINI